MSSTAARANPVFPVQIFEEDFPLLISLSPPAFDEEKVRLLTEGFEKFFERGQRYALLSVTQGDSPALRVKEQKLAGVQSLIGQTFRKLEMLAANGADTQPVATEVQAWLTLEQRLKQTRTWPYDTEMLRTLFLSVLTPLFVASARVVGTYMTEGHF